jgi:hypothetical protein
MTMPVETTEADLALLERAARLEEAWANRDRKRQEIRWYPGVLLVAAFAGGVAFLGGLLAAFKAFGLIH